MNDDAAGERERYLLLQETDKLPPRKTENSNLTQKEKLKKRAQKKALKKMNTTQRGVLRASNLYFNPEERQIFNTLYEQFKEEIIANKTILSATDEQLLIDLCTARIRQYRKTRLESHFNRFMDRQAPQDPIAQTISILKALGLTSEKGKSASDAKELFQKALGKESESLDGESSIERELSYDEWRKQQESVPVEIRRFVPNTDATSEYSEKATEDDD